MSIGAIPIKRGTYFGRRNLFATRYSPFSRSQPSRVSASMGRKRDL